MKIPKGHHTIMSYLIIENVSPFIVFVKNVFNAKPTYIKYYEDNKTILHTEIEIGDSTILVCEATKQWKKNSANLFIYVENVEQCYYKAIVNGAIPIMNLTEKDYGIVCGIKEKFGNTWWLTSLKQ